MEPKKLYFLLASATTAGAIAGAYGANVAVTDEPLKGKREVTTFEDIIRPSPQVVINQVEGQIQSAVCSSINARYGANTCQPSTINYDVTHTRRRGRTRSVGVFPEYPEVKSIQRNTPPALVNWIEARINSLYCSKIEARFGTGICQPSTVDYAFRHVRNEGQSRTIVRLDIPVFCTGFPPADPSPPDPEL